MNVPPLLSGLLRHFVLALRLNFRSPQALVYGFLVPVLFLLAFGAVFRAGTPPLAGEMGQILTITILGGACFGLPTALVAERERGVWRRYRLLPVPPAALLAGAILARLILIATAVLLQLALARAIYGTPLPAHPAQLALAFLFVAFAFLGLGLVVAALADDVPAVQALGQCLFLPMILIGGVGVPLAALPVWAQDLSGFMPGRYAVEALQRALVAPDGLAGSGFALAALAVIGLAAGAIGLKLFRWESSRRLARAERAWIASALLAWLAIGGVAAFTGRLAPIAIGATAWESLTDADLAAIGYEDLPADNEIVTRLAPPFDAATRVRHQSLIARLDSWPPGLVSDAGESVRHLVSIATVADLAADPREAEIARAVYDLLVARFDRPTLRRTLAWVILHPEAGTIVTRAPELGLYRQPPERVVRDRLPWYAKKYLGRILRKIRD